MFSHLERMGSGEYRMTGEGALEILVKKGFGGTIENETKEG